MKRLKDMAYGAFMGALIALPWGLLILAADGGTKTRAALNDCQIALTQRILP